MIYVENPDDDGSAVWGCSACAVGAWCENYDAALAEARRHARACGDAVKVLQRHGPKPDAKRDHHIRRLRQQNMTVRAIAAVVGLSHAGVLKSLRRTEKS